MFPRPYWPERNKALCQSKSKDNIKQQNRYNPTPLALPSSFNKYLLIITYEPSSLLGTWLMMMNKSRHGLSCTLQSAKGN